MSRNTFECVPRLLNGEDPDYDLTNGIFGRVASDSGGGRVPPGTKVKA